MATTTPQAIGSSNPPPGGTVTTKESESSTAEQLDALLRQHERRNAQPEAGAPAKSPAELFREKLAGEYLPIFEETATKYEPRGITLRWNFTTVLNGGRDMEVEVEFDGLRMVMKGLLTRDAIAFQELWSRGSNPGEMRSGPMLRLRTLTPNGLREFIYNQIAALVKAVMRDRSLVARSKS